jgi:hypothetical protein
VQPRHLVLTASRRLVLGCLAILAPLAAATAQLPEVRPGMRVRVVAPGELGGRVEGTVVDRVPDTLRIAVSGRSPVAVPVAAIRSIEIYRGRSRRPGAARGAKLGALTGLGLGLANAFFSDCGGRYCETGYKAGGVIAFGGVGAGIGALIGAARGAELWERVSIPTP